MNKAKLNKTNDNIGWAAWSWNPITGCLGPDGNGKLCPYCYANRMTQRFGQSFEPAFHPERLEAPQNTPVPKVGNTRVFVCSMGELFGPWIPDEWIEKVFEAVRANPQWTFLFLTKCPARLPTLDWPSNAWIGATVDRQERVKPTVKAFMDLWVGSKARNSKFFISCEPLLEEIVWPTSSIGNLDWIIIGALSKGKQKIQPEANWVEHLFSQARLYGVPVWMKDNLIFRPQEVPDDN